MSWFNPPLYKPGNKKCPVCGERVSWIRVYVWSGHQWNCPRCRSILAKDTGRLVTGVILLLLPFTLVWTAASVFWDWPLWVMISFGIPWWVWATALGGLWFDSVVLRRAGQAESTPPLKT